MDSSEASYRITRDRRSSLIEVQVADGLLQLQLHHSHLEIMMSSLTLSTAPPLAYAAPLPPGASCETPIVIVIGPGGGGVQKTRSALSLGSIAKAAGHKVLFVDADAGIGSLSTSLRVGPDYKVDAFPAEERADYADVLLARAKELAATVIIIDLGANELMKLTSSRMVKSSMNGLRRAKCRTYSILSLTPFKTGLEENAAAFGGRTAQFADVVLLYHGRNIGGDFRALDRLKDDFPDFADVHSHDLALVGLMGSRELLPFDFARAPSLRFNMAGAWVASDLLKLAEQDSIRAMIQSESAIPVLAGLAKAAPRNRYSTRTERWQVTDDALTADSNLIVSASALVATSVHENDKILADLARQWINANQLSEDLRAAEKQRQRSEAVGATNA